MEIKAIARKSEFDECSPLHMRRTGEPRGYFFSRLSTHIF
jgi:hypothetical protein